jgi:hypothetical protein
VLTLARGDGQDGVSFSGAVLRPSGTFSISGVPPGAYRAIAQFQVLRQAGAVLASGESGHEYGTAHLEVIAGDVEHVVVTTRPGATVTGSLVFDEPLPPGGRASVSALPAERRSYPVSPVARVDGTTFTIRDLFGKVLIRGNASGGPASWGLKAVLLRGRDITDEPTEMSAADSGHLEVVFTAKAPSIEGVVTDEAGAAAADAIVILFGYDPETWQPRSSFTRTVRTGKDGTFTLRGLREGRYHAVAMAADPITTLSPPGAELLQEFSRFATAVTLNAGETRTLDLRVLRFEER